MCKGIWKVTTCDFSTVFQDKPKYNPQYINNNINPNWLSADVQAHIYPPPIHISKKEDTEDCQTNIFKVKMRCNTESATSETYKLNM